MVSGKWIQMLLRICANTLPAVWPWGDVRLDGMMCSKCKDASLREKSRDHPAGNLCRDPVPQVRIYDFLFVSKPTISYKTYSHLSESQKTPWEIVKPPKQKPLQRIQIQIHSTDMATSCISWKKYCWNTLLSAPRDLILRPPMTSQDSETSNTNQIYNFVEHVLYSAYFL